MENNFEPRIIYPAAFNLSGRYMRAQKIIHSKTHFENNTLGGIRK